MEIILLGNKNYCFLGQLVLDHKGETDLNVALRIEKKVVQTTWGPRENSNSNLITYSI